MTNQPNEWGSVKNPRQTLKELRNPSGETELLFNDSFLADNRRQTIYAAVMGMSNQAVSRHIERARLAYKILNGEKVEDSVLIQYGLNNLNYETYFRVIASNFYSALTHLTEVLLELRPAPEGAVTGVLELLVEGQKEGKRETLEAVLSHVDYVAGQIFDYERELFEKNDFISQTLSSGFCGKETYFGFQRPMEEINTHYHWGPSSNFYAHHKGQWQEVNIARKQFEPEAVLNGIVLKKYNNIQRLYDRFKGIEKRE